MNDDTDKLADAPEETADASPYGPQHGRIDESAGGADSSPFDTMSSDERAAALHRARQKRPDGPPR